MAGLSFVTLLAYDWAYSFQAIRSYYAIADEIILGIDRDRISWSGKPFSLDMDRIWAFVNEVDPAGKIQVFEGDFHSLPTPMGNDTAERNAMSLRCRPGNWVIQMDADEILMNPLEFRDWMGGVRESCCVFATWSVVFKIIGEWYLVVDTEQEKTAVATMVRGGYALCRETREKRVLSPLRLLHVSWGRTGEEVLQKLRNWSHSRDFDVERYYREVWEPLSLENYQLYRNFHPLTGGTWPALKRIHVNEIERMRQVRGEG